jgi:hypothetical protein
MAKAISKAMLELDDSLACVLHTHPLRTFVVLDKTNSKHTSYLWSNGR